MVKDATFVRAMSVLLGKALRTNPLWRPARERSIIRGICLLIALIIFISLLKDVPLSVRQTIRKYPKIGEPYSALDSGFLFYDLPLPTWAQGFIMPVAGATIPDNPHLLPGAPREYRNGRHQGVDIYSPYGTPVLAAKDGRVLLANTKQADVPSQYRQTLLQISKQLFETPPEILELLHGKRVILDHGSTNGRWVVTVYSHLSRIKEGLSVGDLVGQGTVIGFVGNSGTSQAGTGEGAHLHFEIRVNGHYLGEGMTPVAAGYLFKRILKRRDHNEPLGETDN